MNVSFKLNDYDSDGDIMTEGIFLYLGDDICIKIGKDTQILGDMIKDLEKIKNEVKEIRGEVK